MFAKEVPVKRRFQIKGRKFTFMRVELGPPVIYSPGFDPAEGVPVVNLDTGKVFALKPNTLVFIG